MNRRTFVSFITGASLLEPHALRAQQVGKLATIGLLTPRTTLPAELAALREGLREAGWVEGRNIVIETRWTDEDAQRQRQLAAELKAIPVALILALGTTAIAAARDGAPGLPVVMINAGDPIGSRFISSLSKPGGNLTGTSAAGEEVLSKQVELLATAVPRLTRMSVLMNSANPANRFFLHSIERRARTLGMSVERIDVATDDQLGGAVARASGGALQVVSDPMFLRRRAEIAARTMGMQLPSVFGRREYVEAGGMMSYISASTWHWRSAAGFVDKILRGVPPADIPVEQPTKFELVLNLKTAKAIGIALPQTLLQRADEVIS